MLASPHKTNQNEQQKVWLSRGGITFNINQLTFTFHIYSLQLTINIYTCNICNIFKC